MDANLRLAAGLVILIGIALTVLTIAGVAQRRAVLLAAVRATVQLAVVAAALRGVFAVPWTVVLALAVMFTVATYTSWRRQGGADGALRAVIAACGVGAAVPISVIMAIPVLDRTVNTLVAISGIVIGNTMTAATLTGRRLRDNLKRRRDEVEAWLAIGATPRAAVRDLAREAAFEAMVPGLDQTRTVGLVTLPGAFIGALLGGADASAAARFQLVVLVALMCAQALTTTSLSYLLGAPRWLPAHEGANA